MTAAFENIFEYWQTGGLLVPAIALCCFAFWAYYLPTHAMLRRANAAPENFEAELERLLAAGKAKAAAERCCSLPGAAPAALERAIRAAETGGDAVSVFERCAAHILESASRPLPVLKALMAAAPLLGLLGTVNGMIDTFAAAAVAALDKTDRMADGIAHALITTQLGLAVAIPAFFALLRLRKMTGQLESGLAFCRARLRGALRRIAEGRAAPCAG